MDPNQLLLLIRMTSMQMKMDEDPAVFKAHAEELMEYIADLDEWLTKGGFLPAAWDKERQS